MTTQRRPRAWADRIISLGVTSGAQTIPFDLLADLPDTTVKTVTRLIGTFTLVPSDLDAAVTSAQRIDMGIGVASQEAFTAGVVPDPNVQADYPALGWLWIDSQTVIKVNASGTTEAFLYPTVHFDIGAQRKVDRGIIYFVANNTLILGSAMGIQVVGRIRTLSLL